ncbi:unnamed protein product [Mytilus coruscus]|uniref:Uncharacterized protein n=1 Tax=Mytilus coruscus TaxID=42192 RepID=A0A6J8AHM6_MYTCO|nr:unnamed protein product [Mytilus coruscus]
MGNSLTCVDCNKNVPRKVKWLDNIEGNMGRRFCKWVDNETWFKLGSDKYLCSPCLARRQNQERLKQQEKERRKENGTRQETGIDRQQEKIKQMNERTKQFLLSEKQRSNWLKKEKRTINEVEHSQIMDKYLPTRMFDYKNLSSLHLQNNSTPEKDHAFLLNDEVPKDDKCVLQEIIDQGDINETEGETFSYVLLKVQKKIERYENQTRFHRRRQLPNYRLFRRFWFRTFNSIARDKEFVQCIFEISLAVKLTKKYWPRNTQIISFCLLVKAQQKGILLEINTGEGKTCIVAMFSAFLALSQITVDIVSSSPILAHRDYTEWKAFFKSLNVSVSCNLIPKKTEERLECYSKNVVYGTVGSFASDLLRQTFLMENVRGERICEAVIVDEVDCMLLDQGVNYTYLSHAVPGMHHIEPVLFMIWKHIKKHEQIVSENSEQFFLGVLDSFQVVLSSYINLSEHCKETNISPEIQLLYLLENNNHLPAGFINDVLKGNQAQFKRIFTEEKLLECLEFVETIFPITFRPFVIKNDTTVKAVEGWGSLSKTPNGKKIHLLVVNEGLLCVLHPYKDEKEVHYFVKNEIKNFISFYGSKPNKHYIPAYLEGFVENRLMSWIENAFTANHMVNGREYLVKDSDVLPVDFESTGVVQLDTKWGDCLHQFLEIKHGKKLSHITLETNFMSNQEYFSRYTGKIFGVSGTLGTAREKSFLDRQFKLRCQKIPTHRSNAFEELRGIICDTKPEWIKVIQDIVRDQVTKTSNDKQRAVLVICEDINTAEELKKKLTDRVSASVALYIRNDENDENIHSRLKAGDVIVATNIAGRGTDIAIDESIEKAGGLFVLVTFLPQNTRIENQVFGRSARKGQPGSAQIVVDRHSLPSYFSLYEFTHIEYLKHLRDAMEEQRIVDIEKHDFAKVKLKEKLFARYCSFLLEIKQQLYLNGINEKIMLESLHEYWGMWLKMNFEANGPQPENLQDLLNNILRTAKNKLAERNSPCSNISHIIKLANDHLFDNEYALSEKLLTRAIDEDGQWGAIAYYNRAYCYLLKRDKEYMHKAIDDLLKSQECFQLFKEEAVLCLTLSSGNEDEKNNENEVNGTASQFYSRCQIINHFEENIRFSLQQLREFQKQNRDATAEGSSIFSIALGDDNTSKKIETEIYLFWEMGLTELIFVKERKPFCWKGMLVTALGVLQIAVGTLILATSIGTLTQLGWGLIVEGVNDICTGAYAVWKSDQKFMKSWMIGKAVSVAVSIAFFGHNQAKSAAKGVNGVKATVEAVKQHFTTGAEMVVSELKTIGSMVTSPSFRPAMMTASVEVGKELGLQLAKRTGKYLLEVVQKKVLIHFERIAEERIKQETQLAFTEGDTNATIKDFISFHCKINTPKDQICSKYMEKTKQLFYSRNKRILQFSQVLCGCVKDVIKTISVELRTQTDIFVECKPIFDIINGIACASYDVKQLVAIYCTHLNADINEKYKDLFTNEASSYCREGNTDVCMIRQQIIDQTAQFLFGLLKNSFESTGSGILAEKLQIVVEKVVSEFSGEHNVGKETKLGKIIAISSKSAAVGIDLATKGSLDVKAVVEIGFGTAENIVDVVAKGKTKQIAGFGLRTTKTSIQALQPGKTCEIIDATIDIAADGINTFADDKIKPKANFAINATKKGIKALHSGKNEEIIDAVSDIATDGIDKFADDKIKPKANFAINATRTGIKALHSGKTEEIVDAVSDIATDGIDKFADDKIKPKANFAINATRTGIKALHSGKLKKLLMQNKSTAFWKTEEIVDAVSDIATDGIDKFADDKIKPKANFAINATRTGIKALHSGKTEEIVDAVSDIATDGIDKFADDKIKPKANFAINATRTGIKALHSGKTEEIIDAVSDIATDGIDKFADDKIKPKANFAINATTKGIKALHSGKTEEIVDAVSDIAADAIDKFANDEIKPKANFALNATKKGVKALQSGKGEKMCDSIADITVDWTDKFANDKIKDKVNLSLNVIHQSKVKALKSGKTDDAFDAATYIAANGTETCANDDIKEQTNFNLVDLKAV